MIDPFVQKLRHGALLGAEDEALLRSFAVSTRATSSRRDVVRQGQPLRDTPLILSGWACRYRDLRNGKRQITTLYLPGDLCEPFGALPDFMDHGIGAIDAVVAALVPFHLIEQAIEKSDAVKHALWWDLLTASRIEREHIVSLGRRTAAERIGHLFCELHLRLSMIGQTDGLQFEMPLTQGDMSDVLGLTPVHVNRSLRDLRSAGLISLKNRKLQIHDLETLRAKSFFEKSYLDAAKGLNVAATGQMGGA